MPRLQSGVWKHFTPAMKDGRETFLCNYCSKTNSKNATKMQMHLDKCKEYSTFSQQSPGPDGSSSASIPVPSSSFLPTASPGGGQFLIDSVDQGSQAFADECLARAVYATGSPLTLTENAYWRRFLGVLRPAYCPPTRQALGGHLLDGEHDRVRLQVRCAIAKADGVTVLSGGWAGAGAVDYMVATPLPLYFKSAPRAGPVGEALKEAIGEVGPQRVFAVVTDDAPDMAAAWAQVEEAFPHVSAVGCAAFGLRRLFDEVAAQPSLKALHRRAEQVVRYVRERAALAETFRHWQATKMSGGGAGGNAASTALFSAPAPVGQGSDWKGVVSGFTALLEGQATLQAMGLSQTLDVEASVRSSLQDPAFWKGVASSRNLLRLVGTYVEHVRREDAALSGVVELFGQLRYHLGAALPGSVLHSGEQKSVAAALDRCQEFCVRPVHAAAYMLDPKHVGQQQTLSGEQVNSAYFVISNISHHLSLDQGKVLASFARFSAKEGLWKGGGIWSSCRHVSPATWWKGLCSSEPLSPVACAILQIPPTAAACEALRSRLADARARGGGGVPAERLEKMAAVQTNLRALEPSDQDFACPESGEEDAKGSFESETQ